MTLNWNHSLDLAKQQIFLLGITVLFQFHVHAQTGCGDPKDTDFKKVPLVVGLDQPTEMAPLKDGRVLYLEKTTGRIQVWSPSAAKPSTAIKLSVTASGNTNDGLLGLALDPSFPATGWLYVYYSPAGTKAINRISRLTLKGDLIDATSEKVILELATQRNACCHSAGSLAMSPQGHLFLATGDNAAPTAYFQAQAQNTSGNTADLRGKIVRIKPRPLVENAPAPDPGVGSTYDIPEGNLFATGNPKARPEIYAMGFRNPYRITYDTPTGWVMVGDVGPDARGAGSDGNPDSYDEFNVVKSAGNFGWPFFVGENKPYLVGGKAGNPAAPVNALAGLSGLSELPPAIPASFAYAYTGHPVYPNFQLLGRRTAMGGPIYRYQGALDSKIKLPPYFDGKWILFEWSQYWLRLASLDATGKITGITPLFENMKFTRPMDVEIGPDGALYVLEYGETWYSANGDAGLYRIEYTAPKPECLPTSIRAAHAPHATKSRRLTMRMTHGMPQGLQSLATPRNALGRHAQ